MNSITSNAMLRFRVDSGSRTRGYVMQWTVLEGLDCWIAGVGDLVLGLGGGGGGGDGRAGIGYG